MYPHSQNYLTNPANLDSLYVYVYTIFSLLTRDFHSVPIMF